jgi:hypothetical protein
MPRSIPAVLPSCPSKTWAFKSSVVYICLLENYHNAELVLVPSDPVIDENAFLRHDWTTYEFGHLQGIEELPGNQPHPRGMGFVMRAKVDADHASDTTARISQTGFLVYLNCAHIYWMSKKQTSVESSSFGSEFIAMK